MLTTHTAHFAIRQRRPEHATLRPSAVPRNPDADPAFTDTARSPAGGTIWDGTPSADVPISDGFGNGNGSLICAAQADRSDPCSWAVEGKTLLINLPAAARSAIDLDLFGSEVCGVDDDLECEESDVQTVPDLAGLHDERFA